MKGTRFPQEQIVAARGMLWRPRWVRAHKHGVSEQSLHRWPKKFAATQVSDIRELSRLRSLMEAGVVVEQSRRRYNVRIPVHAGH